MIKRVFALCVAALLVFLLAMPALAADEGEPNDSYKKATVIQVNTPYEGNISDSRDTDWFCFTLEQAGYVDITLRHEMIDSSSEYWDIRLLQADGVTDVMDTETTWNVPGNKVGCSSRVGLPAGMYYVKLTYHPYNHSDFPYELTVGFTATAETELEPNGSAKTATPISVDTAYSGAVANGQDVDWYRFVLEESGYVTLSLKHELFESDSHYWDMELLQEDTVTNVTGEEVTWSVKGNKQGTSCLMGLPAGSYYVKVTYHPYNHVDLPYMLQVQFTPTAEAELEPNATASTATEIQPNRDYCGSVANNQDADWYRISLTSQAEVTLNFYHDLLEDTANLWDVCFYDSDTVTKLMQEPVPGHQDKSFDLGQVSPGVYYVKVTYHPYNHSGATYRINISEKHECSSKWVVTREATCTEGGLREAFCVTCGKAMGTEAIEPLGHMSGNWTVHKEATCVEQGYRTAICDRCGQEVEERIEMLPHLYGEFSVISGSKLVPPIVKERICQDCRHADQVKDWSFVWVPIVTVLAALGVLIGIVNYIKALRKG